MTNSTSSLASIQNYLRLSEKLHTAGQPSSSQLDNLAAQNIQAVINLALPTSDDAVDLESVIVTSQGLPYFHLPVNWESPQVRDFELFCAIIDILQDQELLVHCAKNMRVSAFIYLYRVISERVSHEVACLDLRRIWVPTDQWYLLVNKIRALHNLPETDFLPL
jgi:protein tyrosine phosphatase (PTP) superfamily phosphohydrolase (DUF442 family)